ncbi:hypothetical protein [Burkholderia vietnamiensis]|uniref:hypothetical protein n=1 Tax=Burkholderia vietnamiensis TaxID=60552 RepID=UPI000754C926|nr:hypothetical protein [Burkholderia vietnamiensis]KVR99602.1 hypothetical protein WK29_30055 [Burkholderia vietnamiensis]KVS32709.1 hypothetical protein WK35_07880 [Burkholderia vietnamiensis]MCA7985254.1 hypothetical protein [Burkholderia vietnamiensis]HDR8933005.1 hypothetical protein [Burkholderia vietnamiensis]
MNELEQAVSTSFANIVASGAIEKAIEAQLTKTITSIIDDQLRSYSDFGEKLKEHVKESLQVDFQGLGLPGYNDLILKIVRKKVAALTEQSIAESIEKQMADLLTPAPKEIKLSELVERFINHHAERFSCSCDGPDRITLRVEESQYGSRWISLDKAEGTREYDCEIRFGVSDQDGRMFGLRLDKREIEKTLFIGFYGFEREIFQLHAAGSKLIIDGDSDSINTYYPGRDY